MSGVIGQNLLFIALVQPKKVYVYFIKVIDPAHFRSVYWQNNHLRMLEVKFVQNAPRFVIKKKTFRAFSQHLKLSGLLHW